MWTMLPNDYRRKQWPPGGMLAQGDRHKQISEPMAVWNEVQGADSTSQLQVSHRLFFFRLSNKNFSYFR